MSQRCFPCDTGGILRGLYNAAEMCFSGVGMTLLWHCRAVEETDLMAHCQLFLTADCDDLLSTVKDKVQACLIVWWRLGWEQAESIYRNIVSGKVSVCRMHIARCNCKHIFKMTSSSVIGCFFLCRFKESWCTHFYQLANEAYDVYKFAGNIWTLKIKCVCIQFKYIYIFLN